MTIVKHQMTRKVAFVRESDELEAAHAAMEALGIRHVPVLRDDEVVGVLSDRDVLLHARKHGKSLTVPKVRVKEVMSSPVVTCIASASVRSVAMQMVEHHIHCLPVVTESGKLVGIITSTDLLELLIDRDSAPLESPLPFRFEVPSPLAPMFA